MKNKILITTLILFGIIMQAYVVSENKLTSTKTHIKFFSTTPAEDIEAHNYKSVSTIDLESGEVVFSVPMQSFEFKKALMQRHFNQPKFLDTKAHPKAKLKGTIDNIKDVNFNTPGTYQVKISGEMQIKGVTRPVTEAGTIQVSQSSVKVNSKFNVTLADYGITFEKGKPSRNIAKTVEVTVEADYQN